MAATDLTPEFGDPDTCMARLAEYVSPYYPTFVQRTRGASSAAIQLYCKLAGLDTDERPLPVSYRRFLEMMGLDDAGLFKNLQIEATLATVTRLYEDCIRSEPDSLNPELPVIAVYVIGDQISLDLTTPSPEPEILDTSDGERMRFRARSWETLVMQAAMLHVEPLRLPYGRSFSVTPRRAAEILPRDAQGNQSAARTFDELTASLQLATSWPSDSRIRIATSEQFSVFAQLDEGNRLLVSTFSPDETTLASQTIDLADKLGATHIRVLKLIDGMLKVAP